jgi:hypothetical protein
MTIIAKGPFSPRWGPLVIVAIVLYAGVQFAVQWRRPHPPEPPPAGLTAADTASNDTAATDRLISRALGQVPPIVPDSTEIKTGWRDEVRGIDLAVFTPTQRELFVRYANAEPCTCGCGFTLAACRENDLTCPVSLPRVEGLRDSVLAGHITSARGLRERPQAPGAPPDPDPHRSR